jgi:YVTN family beta-propeller protein
MRAWELAGGASIVVLLTLAGVAGATAPLPRVGYVPATSSPGGTGLATNLTIPVGNQPHGILYDPGNHRIYVANFVSKSISVINPKTETVVKTIPVHTEAWELAYDPENRMLYVASDNVSGLRVINTTSNSVAGTLYTGCGTVEGVLYDAGNGRLYAECPLTNTLAVVDPSSGLVLQKIHGFDGEGDNGIAVDPHTGDVFVGDWDSDTVTVISGTTNGVLATVTVGADPDGTFYDAASDSVYVNLEYQDQVVVLNAGSFAVEKGLPVGAVPHTVAFAPGLDSAVDSNWGSGNLSMIDSSTNDVVGALYGGDGPWGIAYDPANGLLYVADELSASVQVLGPVSS